MSSYNAWDITKASYCNVFSDIRGFINAAWRWIVLFLAFTVLGSFFAGLLNLPILSSASVIIWIVASIAFAVDWQKKILLESTPGKLHFGAVEWRYLGFYILFILALTLPTYLLSVLSNKVTDGSTPSEMATVTVVIVLFFFAMAVLLYRFVLIFPATAIKNKEMTLKLSWQATRQHGIQIFIGILLCLVPLNIVISVLQRLMTHLLQTGTYLTFFLAILTDVVIVTAFMALIALLSSFLALTYRTLAPTGD